MSGFATGIEGCASWAPASTRSSHLTSRSGNRRPMTALEHYQGMASRPLEAVSRYGPALFAGARLGEAGVGALPPVSPEPGLVASRVTPSFVHERDETERYGAGAPLSGGVPAAMSGNPCAISTTLLSGRRETMESDFASAFAEAAAAPRTLNYMADPHRLGTHQRQKGYQSPTPRSSGPPVQFNSIYGLPVRYTAGSTFGGTDRRLGGCVRGGIEGDERASSAMGTNGSWTSEGSLGGNSSTVTARANLRRPSACLRCLFADCCRCRSAGANTNAGFIPARHVPNIEADGAVKEHGTEPGCEREPAWGAELAVQSA